MRNLILAIATLICLLTSPLFFFLGLVSLGEEPMMGLLSAFVLTPILAALAIVFEFVREQLEEREDKKSTTRPSDLAGTPWAKSSDHTLRK